MLSFIICNQEYEKKNEELLIFYIYFKFKERKNLTIFTINTNKYIYNIKSMILGLPEHL